MRGKGGKIKADRVNCPKNFVPHCSYITDLIKPYTPGRLLRSSNQLVLSTSKFNLKTYGGRSFTIAAPSVWNALPFELRSCNSLSSFKSKLKTWLFKIGYDVVVQNYDVFIG